MALEVANETIGNLNIRSAITAGMTGRIRKTDTGSETGWHLPDQNPSGDQCKCFWQFRKRFMVILWKIGIKETSKVFYWISWITIDVCRRVYFWIRAKCSSTPLQLHIQSRHRNWHKLTTTPSTCLSPRPGRWTSSHKQSLSIERTGFGPQKTAAAAPADCNKGAQLAQRNYSIVRMNWWTMSASMVWIC